MRGDFLDSIEEQRKRIKDYQKRNPVAAPMPLGVPGDPYLDLDVFVPNQMSIGPQVEDPMASYPSPQPERAFDAGDLAFSVLNRVPQVNRDESGKPLYSSPLQKPEKLWEEPSTGGVPPAMAQLLMGQPSPAKGNQPSKNIVGSEMVVTPSAKPDFTDRELLAAQEQARRNRLASAFENLGSSLVAGLTGVQQGAGARQSQQAQEQAPVQELLERRRADEVKRAQEMRRMEEDPNSAANIAFREQLGRAVNMPIAPSMTLANWKGAQGDIARFMMESERENRKLAAAERIEKAKAELDAAKEDAKSKREIEKDERKRTIAGVGVFASDKLAEDFRKANAQFLSGQQNIDRLIEIAKMPPSRLADLDLRAEASVLQSLLIGQNREQIVGPGAMTESEVARLENIFRNPTRLASLTSADVKALQSAKSAMQRVLKNQAVSYLERPAELSVDQQKRLRELRSRKGQSGAM